MEKSVTHYSKSEILSTFGYILYNLAQWLMTLLVFRLTDLGIAGILSLALSISGSFSVITMFNMRYFQISDINDEYSNSQYFSSRIITAIISVLMCMVYAFIVNTNYQAICIMAFMGIRLAEGFADVLHGIQQKRNRYDLIGISLLIRSVGSILAFTISLLLRKDILLAIIAVFVVNALIVYMYDYRHVFSRSENVVNIRDAKIKTLLKRCLPLALTEFLMSLIIVLPRQFCEKILGTDILGAFATVAAPAILIQISAQYACNPLVPKITEVYWNGKKDEFKKSLLQLFGLFLTVCVVVIIGALLLGRWGLNLLYGAEILDYYYAFMPIIISYLLYAFCWVLMSVIIATRKIDKLLKVVLMCFVLILVISAPCINRFGMVGISYSQIIILTVLASMMVAILFQGISGKEVKQS